MSFYFVQLLSKKNDDDKNYFKYKQMDIKYIWIFEVLIQE